MRVNRLFVEAPLQPDSNLALPASAAAHALRVLRLKPGDAMTLFNGDGKEYPARLITAGTREARVAVQSVASPARESPLQITLVQAIVRGEKMDWIIQKATELGASRITPVSTERGEVRLDPTRAHRRHEHWRAVAIAACEQCGRNVVPRIDAPVELAAWATDNAALATVARWMLCPDAGIRLRDLAPPPGALTLAVGPEGGFGDGDLAALRAQGFHELGLGPRILRTETAGIAAIAALQTLYGDS